MKAVGFGGLAGLLVSEGFRVAAGHPRPLDSFGVILIALCVAFVIAGVGGTE